MLNNIDLTVIIPVHSVTDEKFTEYLDLALNSISLNDVKPAKVLISRCTCMDVMETLNKFDLSKYDLDIEIIENKLGKSFQTQLNFNASNIKTEYFSFLEFDDELSINYLKNVKKYIEAYPEIEMFLPIISNVDPENRFYGFSNEALWAYGFSDTQGILDHETLLEYPNINIDGMIIKTETFNNIGGMKSSMKLTFNYEFLLRFTNQGKKIMIIPKIGYKHVNMRPGSLFWEYKNSTSEEMKVTPEEAAFWIDTAKKEFFYPTDRNITYARTNN